MTTHQEAIDSAKSTAAWINQFQQKTEQGLCWSRTSEKPKSIRRDLYHGSAGIAVFMAEMYLATGDSSYKETAKSAATDIAHYLHSKDFLSCAMLTGWPGYAFALNEIAKHCDAPEFRATAIYCLDKLRAQATEIGSGIGFIEDMPFADITGFTGKREIFDTSVGAAGAALVLIYAHEEGLHTQALEWARAICDRLLDVSQQVEGGLTWGLMSDCPFPFEAPNFAHGGAGVGYLMARLYQHIPQEKYLEAAIEAANYLKTIATPVGSGHLVRHTMARDGEGRFYLGQCHGPPGTARLFRLLSDITGQDSWNEWGQGLTDGLMATNAPEERGQGLWNNVSQCCCDSGIGDHALLLYESTKQEKYLDLAQRTAAEIFRRSEKDTATSNIYWPQAEHRARPDFVENQTGYMQGAAGVGSFLLHLATLQTGKSTKIIFPDAL